MGLIEKFIDKDKTANMTVKDPRVLFESVLKHVSGASLTREVKYDILYQIVAFKGVVDGVGTSTLVANTALALADLGLNVCVIDTSILAPTQDVLLKSNYVGNNIEEKDRLDWFDMPYTRRSPLHSSSLSSKISILSFYGKQRSITDILSTMDNDALVQMAFTELHNKFDMILVDCCQETTCVNTTSLQMSQRVIQVWNDTPTVIENIDMFITNQVLLSCPLDKMRYVICSKTNPDVMGNLNSIIDQYRLNILTTTVISRDISRVLCQSQPLWQFASTEEDIIGYTNAIIDICASLLNVNDPNSENDLKVSSKKEELISSNDYLDQMAEEKSNGPKIYTTLEDADNSLKKGFFGKKKKKNKSNEEENYTVGADGREYPFYDTQGQQGVDMISTNINNGIQVDPNQYNQMQQQFNQNQVQYNPYMDNDNTSQGGF